MTGSGRAADDKALYEGAQSGGTSRQPGSSHMPGSFADDAGTTASVKSGIIGEPQSGSALGESGPNDSLNTNKALPREPESAGAGYSAGGGGLTGTSLPDRSVGRLVLGYSCQIIRLTYV